MKNSNKYIILCLVTFLIYGTVTAMDFESKSIYSVMLIATPVIFGLFVFAWCTYHAAENNISYTGLYRFLAAIFPIPGVPIYLFRFFGLKRGGVMFIKSVLVFAAIIVCYKAPILIANIFVGVHD